MELQGSPDLYLDAEEKNPHEGEAASTEVGDDEEHARLASKVNTEHEGLKELVRKTIEEIKILRGLITEIPNTKKEIKKAINKLDALSKIMQTSIMFIPELIAFTDSVIRKSNVRKEKKLLMQVL